MTRRMPEAVKRTQDVLSQVPEQVQAVGSTALGQARGGLQAAGSSDVVNELVARIGSLPDEVRGRLNDALEQLPARKRRRRRSRLVRLLAGVAILGVGLAAAAKVLQSRRSGGAEPSW